MTACIKPHRAGAALVVGLALLTGIARAATPAEQSAWRSVITRAATPQGGCYTAAFPDTAWHPVACTTVPLRPYLPRSAGHPAGRVVGNGHDYAAVTGSLTSAALGAFPSVTGVKSERDGGANVYSIQLNSGFMNTAGCNGGAAGCLTWLQYVYSSSSQAAFMQYWLINYGNHCPAGGWMSYSGSCYRNSAAVGAPKFPIAQLGSLSITGTAAAGGSDVLTLTAGSQAYRTSGPDSVVDLATAWTQSEFNIIGDGGGSRAVFNRGSRITVGIALSDGSSAAPRCAANAGTTGETNNLNLGSCSTSGGGTPSIRFTESN